MAQQRNRERDNNAGDAGLRRSGRSAGARANELEDLQSARELTSSAEDREESMQQAGSRSMHVTATRAKVNAREKGQGITNRGSKLEQARQNKVAPERATGARSRRRRESA
jgi:hypothetical protein